MFYLYILLDFQEYAGATCEKVEYPPEELRFLHNQIEKRAYVIEQNLAKMGKGKAYSLLDIGCGGRIFAAVLIHNKKVLEFI